MEKLSCKNSLLKFRAVFFHARLRRDGIRTFADFFSEIILLGVFCTRRNGILYKGSLVETREASTRAQIRALVLPSLRIYCLFSFGTLFAKWFRVWKVFISAAYTIYRAKRFEQIMSVHFLQLLGIVLSVLWVLRRYTERVFLICSDWFYVFIFF